MGRQLKLLQWRIIAFNFDELTQSNCNKQNCFTRADAIKLTNIEQYSRHINSSPPPPPPTSEQDLSDIQSDGSKFNSSSCVFVIDRQRDIDEAQSGD